MIDLIGLRLVALDGCDIRGEVVVEIIDRLISAESERDELKAKLAELDRQAPVDWQYQRRDGSWKSFENEKHSKDTMDSESWLTRPLYAQPKPDAPAQRITEQDAREIWAHGYNAGHNDGIGCGHDLAPRCKHLGEKEFYADDIATLLTKLNENREPEVEANNCEALQWGSLSTDEVLKIAPMAGNFTEWEKECFAGGFRRCAGMIKVTANKAEVPSELTNEMFQEMKKVGIRHGYNGMDEPMYTAVNHQEAQQLWAAALSALPPLKDGE